MHHIQIHIYDIKIHTHASNADALQQLNTDPRCNALQLTQQHTFTLFVWLFSSIAHRQRETAYRHKNERTWESARDKGACARERGLEGVDGKLVDNFSHKSDVTSLQDPFTSRPFKTPFYFYYCVPRKIRRHSLPNPCRIFAIFSTSSLCSCTLRFRV